MGGVEAGLELRAFNLPTIDAFMKKKDTLQGIIHEIQVATDTTLNLIDEQAAVSFDSAKEAEISQNLVSISKAASALAQQAKVSLFDKHITSPKMAARRKLWMPCISKAEI